MPERFSPTASRRITPPAPEAHEPAQQVRTTGGVIIAVYGPRADVGVTTVAASLARAFRSMGSDDVALAELDPRVIRARSQALDLLGNGELTSQEHVVIPGLDAVLVRQREGLWTLAMTRPRTPAIGDAKGVTVALDTIRRRFPVTIADLEHQVNERTLAAFDAADRILLVTEGAVPSLRGMQRVLRLCRRLNYPDEKMCVVLNRFDAAGSLASADVASALKREIYWKVAEDSSLTMHGLAERLLNE